VNTRRVSHPRGQLIYSTAQFANTKLVSGELIREPASLVHAKVMGTTLTHCGESTLSWFKFWDQPFDQVRSDRCASCASCAAIVTGRHRDVKEK
jgi:hypothetical protein